jgi:hypothetical protein
MRLGPKTLQRHKRDTRTDTDREVNGDWASARFRYLRRRAVTIEKRHGANELILAVRVAVEPSDGMVCEVV